MLIIFLTFPGDMHWKITNSKAKMTRNSHIHKNFKQDTLYYINFVPQQELFASFFCRNCYKGKLLEENYKSLGVHVCWKTIISILGMKENNKQKTLLHGFTCTTCILNHQNILYHQKPIVCFTFASQFQIYRNFLVFNNIFNHNRPMRKEKLF